MGSESEEDEEQSEDDEDDEAEEEEEQDVAVVAGTGVPSATASACNMAVLWASISRRACSSRDRMVSSELLCSGTGDGIEICSAIGEKMQEGK